jgi:hypothetical protein
VARTPLNPSLADVWTSLGEVIDELGQPLTRKERKHGWVEETRSHFSTHLAAIRDDIAADLPPHPRDLPSQVEVVRGLDAMGVALGDPLTDRVMNAFATARRFANRTAKTADAKAPVESTDAPVNEALMRIVLDAAAFFELSGDDVVDPYIAVKQLEWISWELKGLDPSAKDAFVSLALAEAEATQDPRYRAFLLEFPEGLGLRDED